MVIAPVAIIMMIASVVFASVVIASVPVVIRVSLVAIASVANVGAVGRGLPARVCYVRVGVGSIVPPGPPTLRQRASAKVRSGQVCYSAEV